MSRLEDKVRLANIVEQSMVFRQGEPDHEEQRGEVTINCHDDLMAVVAMVREAWRALDALQVAPFTQAEESVASPGVMLYRVLEWGDFTPREVYRGKWVDLSEMWASTLQEVRVLLLQVQVRGVVQAQGMVERVSVWETVQHQERE